MSGSFNGYAIGETRTSEHKPRKQDNGHSVVQTSVTCLGLFRMRYAVKCECGRRYTSRTDISTAWRTHGRHQQREASRS